MNGDTPTPAELRFDSQDLYNQAMGHKSNNNVIYSSTLQRAYRFRMRPNRGQEQALHRQAGARRFVWNWALARRKAYFAEHGASMPAARLSRELTVLKEQPETAWLRGVDAQLLQQALRDLQAAFGAFFEKRARFPRFKSKKRDTPRFRIPQRVKAVYMAVAAAL